jgi:hypothetical protein
MNPPRLRDVVELSELASKVYRYLDPQEYVGKLAPSLGMILQKDLGIADIEVSSEFLEPVTFLSITHFRKPLIDALRIVNTSLQNVSDAVPVLSLTHAMGLGKTHFLTLLYHLYTKVPTRWNDIEESLPEESILLVEATNYKIDIARRALVIAIDLKYIPSEALPYNALFLTIQKIFEKYKKRFLVAEASKAGLDEFEELLQRIHRYDPKDAAREFVRVLSRLAVNIPILIIVDEVYAAVFEAIAGASKEYIDSVKKVLLFLASLADELRGRFPAVLVYASAMHDVQRWRDVARLHVDNDEKGWLKEAVKFFEERTRRVSPISVRDVNDEEALEIVKKRIIRLKTPMGRVLSESILKELQYVLSEVVGEAEAAKFIDELKRTYPFSPMYRELVRKLIIPAYSADFAPGKLQHLRDLIKISSSVLGRILENDGEAWLVSTAHVEHDDIKHLLDEGYANEWRREVLSWSRFLELLEAETKDRDLVKMVKGAISAIYLKSVTNNAWDLILMMTKSPDTLSLEELDRRSLHQRRLLLSLVGVVDITKLKRYTEVLEKLDIAPYIHSVERSEGKYYYASLFENPYQLLKDIRESEIRRLKDEEGRLKIEDAIKYVRETLEEYALVSEFRKNALLNMDFVKVDDFERTARFTEHLDKDEFTILVISPLDMANKLLVEEAKFGDILESIRSSIDANRNKVKYLNMFAVVIPYMDEETLERLVNSLAEIKASEIVVNMLKSDRGMIKFAEHTTERHRSLLDLVRKPEEEFKRIVMEIIDRFRERLETYAQQLNNAAVQNFTSDFVSLFKKVVTYNPSTNKVEILDLAASIDGQPQTLSKVFASLPVWIANAVRGKLQVVGATGISARLIEWIKKMIGTDVVRDRLRKDREYRYSISSIIEGLVRGWPDIPIKPESVKSIESAVRSLPGRVIQTDDREFKLIIIDIENDDLIIRPKEILPPPPPPPPKRIIRFEVVGVKDVNIVLGSITRIEELVQRVKTLHIEVHVGSDTEISIKGSIDKVSELTESLVKYLNHHINDISSCKLAAQFAEALEKDEASRLVRRIGLHPARVKFLESQG